MNPFRDLLEDKVPQASIDYCVALWEEAPFRFKLSKARSSKLGDYRYDPRTKSHQVTVNENLNPYQFLITYIHEVAHRRVHQTNRRLKAHGVHWKNEFKRLLLPVLNDGVFPDEVLRPLAKHMKNPKASTASDPVLFAALANCNAKVGQRLVDLDAGVEFKLRNRRFRLLEKKRTRALCLDLDNNRRYLIPMIAEVKAP